MDPQEEIRLLKEEVARLKRELELQGGIVEPEQPVPVEQPVERYNFRKGEYSIKYATEIYDIFRDTIEHGNIPITGEGESYKVTCANGFTVYLMKSISDDVRPPPLMIQVSDDELIYAVLKLEVYDGGYMELFFRRMYNSDEVYLWGDRLIYKTVDERYEYEIDHIERVDRVVEVKHDELAITTSMGYEDMFYLYELIENGERKKTPQIYKRFEYHNCTVEVIDGEIKTTYPDEVQVMDY